MSGAEVVVEEATYRENAQRSECGQALTKQLTS